MFSTNDGRGYGLIAFDLQEYSRSLAFIVALEAVGHAEYSKMHGALRGTFATKETAPSKYAFDGAVYAKTVVDASTAH